MTYKERILFLEEQKININKVELFTNLIYENFSSLEMSIWKDIDNTLGDQDFLTKSLLFIDILRSLANEINRKIFILNCKAEEELKNETNLGD